MNLKSLFDIRGTNYWIIAMAVAANLLWTTFTLIIALYVLDVRDLIPANVQVGMMVSEFLGPLLIGWFSSWLAFDDRGPTYGVVGAIGSVVLILLTLTVSGVIALLLSIVALAGGFNGGTLSRYRGRRH